ncbi:MAG: hypothetical protein Q7U78_11875 [Gallionella sp.]|nr:hypothetical protein [Gallionella sp.]
MSDSITPNSTRRVDKRSASTIIGYVCFQSRYSGKESKMNLETRSAHITPVGGNVFADLGFEPKEAAELQAESKRNNLSPAFRPVDLDGEGFESPPLHAFKPRPSGRGSVCSGLKAGVSNRIGIWIQVW